MKAAFFDLKGEELTVHTFEKNGKTSLSGDAVSTRVGEGQSFSIANKNDLIEESYLSLPFSLLNFRVLELPFQDEKKLRELLPFEISNLILGGPETVVFDTYPLQGGEGKHKVLVVYVMKDTLRALLTRLKSSGFDPRAVTSIELSDAIGASASEPEIMGRLLSPRLIPQEERVNIAVKEMSGPTINLRREEFAYTADSEKTKKSLRITAVLAAVLFLVFLSDMTLTALSVKRANTSIKDEIRRTYLSIFPNEKKISSEIYQLRAHLKELQDKEGTFIGVSPLQVMLELTKAVRPGVAMSEITLTRDLVVVKGECPSLSDVQKIKSDLEAFLTSVTISDTKTSAQNRTLFTITGKEKK